MKFTTLPFEYEGRYADHYKTLGFDLDQAAVLEGRDRQLEDYLAALKGGAQILVAASDSTAIYKERASYICDGTADQVEINQALAAVVNAGLGVAGEVLLAPGNFYITATINVMGGAGLRGLTGWGYAGPQIVVAGPLTTTSAVYLDYGSALRGICLWGQKYDFDCGVKGENSCRVEDCYITAIGPTDAVSGDPTPGTYACDGIRMLGGHVVGNTLSYCSGDMVAVSNSAGFINDNYMLRAGKAAVRLTGSGSGFIHSNDISNTGDIYKNAINLDGSAIIVNSSSRSYVSDNEINTSKGSGIYVLSGKGHGSRFHDNYINEARVDGIHLVGINNAGVHGNLISNDNFGTHGIVLDSVTDSVISGNTVRVTGTDKDGIQITASNNNFITANKVIGRDSPSDARYGVNIVSGTGNIVCGNDLRGVWVTAPLVNTATGTLLTYPSHATYGDNFT